MVIDDKKNYIMHMKTVGGNDQFNQFFTKKKNIMYYAQRRRRLQDKK